MLLPLNKYDGGKKIYIKSSMSIVVNGIQLPKLGYFNENDVDILGWAERLNVLIEELDESSISEHLSYEGEIGTLLYLFKRNGETISVSVFNQKGWEIREPLKGYEDLKCSYKELKNQVFSFFNELYNTLYKEVPNHADTLWKRTGVRLG